MRQYVRAYIPGGCYFFTVTLADRRSDLLISHIDALRHAFRRTRDDHPFTVEAIVVLPDHLHAIWTLPPDDADFSLRWSLIKSRFSRSIGCTERISASRAEKRERGIWQRRFFEHAIRSQDDLDNHIHYIHWNPVKHGWAERAGDWPHSSIHRFIRDGKLESGWSAARTVQAMRLE